MDRTSVKQITVVVAEKPHKIENGTVLYQLRDSVKPGADIVVLNGVPVVEDCVLKDGDSVVFIRRGEIPGPNELEALMMARHTPGVHEVIRRSSVGIAGLGGLGSAVAISLARMGVGKLILVDFDVVEPSNLNRQQYFIDQIGMLKTDALAETLARVNPHTRVEKHCVRVSREEACSLFENVQIVVEAFDHEASKAMLVEALLKGHSKIMIVAASGMAGYASANAVRTEKFGQRLYICGDRCTSCEPGCGLMAPRVGVTAQHQANAVVRLLLGEYEA